MDLSAYIHLIFLCVANIIFTFSGIILNCEFLEINTTPKEIMSFHDLSVVVFRFGLSRNESSGDTGLSYLLAYLIYDFLPKLKIYLLCSSVLLSISFVALLVMSIEGYLGAYYPIFHRTSVTRRRLLTLLAILLIPVIVMNIIFRNAFVISCAVFLLVFTALFLLPFIFVNFKLFIIASKVQLERAVSPGKRTSTNFKNISTSLWAVACLILMSIPNSFYIAFNFAEKDTNTERLSAIWALTCSTMNCTSNSLIFFWKNKVLRTEGIKMLKTLKDLLFRS